MNILPHQTSNIKIAKVLSESIVISTIEDALNLMADIYYHGYDAIVLRQKNITPEFFDLKTGIAGEILQKFSNYRMRLAIVGDFVSYSSKSFNDYIFESNKNRQINFVGSLEDAIERLG